MVHARPLSALCGLFALCLLTGSQASAATFSPNGTFAADNSTYELTFTEAGSSNFTAATTSFATGGFLPVLTLFNDTSGMFIDTDGSGPEAGQRDASLSDLLGTGTYDLFLTEFPNSASGTGNLSGGFLFSDDPTATGDFCGVAGGTFLNTSVAACSQRTDAYALTINTNAPASTVTPEPPSALLMLLPLAGVVAFNRRKLAGGVSL